MDRQTFWVVALTLGFPTLVVGGAVIGGRLSPTSRRHTEKFVLLPLLVLLGTLGLIFAGLQHRWLDLSAIGFGLALSLERLLKHIRAPRLSPSE
jgi:cyanate permease